MEAKESLQGRLTIFTTPKPFSGHTAIIQRNAIQSWCQLIPADQVLIFGDGEGVAEESLGLGVHHIPQVQSNEFGTPLISGMFAEAERISQAKIMCYVNADIILMNDLSVAVERVARYTAFLMVGCRCDLDLDEPWNFDRPDWDKALRDLAVSEGSQHSVVGLDYFVYPRGFWGTLPAFAIGRTAWDNWLIYRARELGVPVIDATDSLLAIHQNHGYEHHSEGSLGVWEGPEAKRNQRLAGGPQFRFSIADATHTLTPSGIRYALSISNLKRRFVTAPLFHPRLEPIVKPVIGFAKQIRKLAERIML